MSLQSIVSALSAAQVCAHATDPTAHFASILSARENRAQKRERLFNGKCSSLVTATMNIPGPIKSSSLINRSFDLALQDLFVELEGCQLFLVEKESNAAGPYAIFLIENSIQPLDMKSLLVNFETTHPIGRWLDLDVYLDKDTLIKRSSLNLLERTCFLCNENATICRKQGNHSLQALCSYTMKHLKAYVATNGIYHPNSL